MKILFNASLLLHLISLVLMVGTTLAGAFINKKFWLAYLQNSEKGLIIRSAIAALPAMMAIGLVLLILSGVGMMVATMGVFGAQVWFRIKIALVVLVAVNGIIVGRRQGKRLKAMLATPDVAAPVLVSLRRQTQLFYVIQLTLFFLIFLLSAFKFN